MFNILPGTIIGSVRSKLSIIERAIRWQKQACVFETLLLQFD